MSYGYNPSFNTFTNPSFTSNQYPSAYPSPMTQRTNNNGMLWVQGEAGAKSFIVGAGQTVTLFDSEEPVFYIKSADMSGMPTMRAFSYEEITGKTASKSDFNNELDKYLTKDEFYAEIEKIKELRNDNMPVMPTDEKPTKKSAKKED